MYEGYACGIYALCMVVKNGQYRPLANGGNSLRCHTNDFKIHCTRKLIGDNETL